MNNFKYTLKLNEVKAAKTKAGLKKLLTTHYNRANTNATAAYNIDSMCLTTAEDVEEHLQDKVYNLKIAIAARSKWIANGWELSELAGIYRGRNLTFNFSLKGNVEDLLQLCKDAIAYKATKEIT